MPLPCQESLEKQRHGKPLPSVSKSLGRGRSYVVNKAHATCCKARTASGNAGWAKRASFPMLTLETSGKIFLSPGNRNPQLHTPPSANRTAFTQPDPAREARTGETAEGMKTTTCSNRKTKHATCHQFPGQSRPPQADVASCQGLPRVPLETLSLRQGRCPQGARV